MTGKTNIIFNEALGVFEADGQISHLDLDTTQELLRELEELRAKTQEPEPIKWQATGDGLTRYLTQTRYEKLTPQLKRWYEPYIPSTEKAVRRMLCLMYAGPLAYMDDGEASDSREHPTIDFLRDSPELIQEKMHKRGAAKYHVQQRVITEGEAAIRTLDHLGYTYTEGVQLFRPPINERRSLRRGYIREVLLSQGFTIKPGQSDLKEYVYLAVEALMATKDSYHFNDWALSEARLAALSDEMRGINETPQKEQTESQKARLALLRQEATALHYPRISLNQKNQKTV